MPEIYFPGLGIKINEISRVAFSLFGLPVYWYGILIASSMFIGYFILKYELKRLNEDMDPYLDLAMIAIVTSIIGARLYYVLFSLEYYKDNLWEIFDVRGGGLAIYGAIIAAILTAIIFAKVRKMDFFHIADLFAPLLVLGQAIGRWGNFFNMEAFGGYTDSTFAMALRLDSMRYIPESLVGTEVTYFGTQYIKVQPTFLYESFFCIIIFAFLMIYRKHKKFEGELFIMYLFLYSLSRFFVEGLRTDQLLINGLIPASQIVAVLLIIISIAIYIERRFKIKKLK